VNQPATKAKEKSGKVAPARLAAFEILRRVAEGSYSSVLLAMREDLDSRDRALCQELVLGVLRWQLWLDQLIAHYSGREVVRLDLPVTLALRLALYQLRFLTRVPQSAAVNESVNLVRKARLRSAEGFVNAVLRRATREPDYDPIATNADPLERIALGTSHPRWLIQRWEQAFGFDETERFARANNEPAPRSFRVVSDRETEVLDRLRTSGAILEASQLVVGAWRLKGGAELAHELALTGQIYFQDEASQLVSRVVAAESGDRVLDVCAAPGSKSTQIAGNEKVSVFAGDVHEHRLETVIQTAKSQGLRNLHCLVLDGTRELPFKNEVFDRVLVDAPCSGTGTLRHNPEIRWRISAADLPDLSTRQRQILSQAARVVKQGGRLVYSTCSVEPEENEAVVQEFLEQNEQFELLPLPVPERLLTATGYARTWPQRDDTDGFFIAALARKQ
jgi:16S rRNA (cytosine967-C5)-methyltransferase